MITIGIDPGLQGGFAVLADGSLQLKVMPTVTVGTKEQLDEQQIVQFFSGYTRLWETGPCKITACIELVSAMPKQGVTSMFNFGTGWGIVRGIMSGMHIPYVMVRPQAWQKVMLAGMARGSEYQVASRLWPNIDWRATLKCRKPHEGLVDAALIAAYAQRTWGAANATA